MKKSTDFEKSIIKKLEKQNKELQKEFRRAKKKINDDFARLTKVASLINSSLDIDEVLEMIINELRRFFDIEGVVIMLVNKERTKYTYFKISFPDYLQEITKTLDQAGFPLTIEDGGRIAQSILEKKFYYFTHIDYSNIESDLNKQAAEQMKIKSNVITPVIVKGKAIGAILMTTHTKELDLKDEDINLLKHFIEQIAAAIHNSILYKELESERETLEEKVKQRTVDLEKTISELEQTEKTLKERNEIIEKDLNYAQKIQQGMLPSTPPNFKGFKIHSVYKPLDKLGGDIFDFIKIDDDMLGILMCDVSGHGVPASFITSMIKIGIPHSKVIQKHSSVFLEFLRDNLIEHLHGMYFTSIYCVINNKKNTMSFSNAGHQPLIIIREGEILEYSPKSSVIGFDREEAYNFDKIELKKGDRIILYTDGILETLKSREKNNLQIYGKDRFYSFIKKNYNLSQKKFLDKLFQDVHSFTDDKSFSDDVAIILIDKL